MEHIASEDMTYDGERYYAYQPQLPEGPYYLKRLFDVEGTYHEPIYEWDGSLMRYLDEVTLMKTDGFVMPHVSVCKDTSKVNYNLYQHETLITSRGFNNDAGYMEIYDSNDNLLGRIEMSLTRDIQPWTSVSIVIPSDGVLRISHCNVMYIDNEYEQKTISVGWEYIGDLEVSRFINIPKNAEYIFLDLIEL